VAGDLTDLLCGRLPARSDPLQDLPQDLSLFKSVGMALQDLAAAQAILTSG
jgi:ornithine cyclodeaminase/alanine dehydrogenase-like protein (mu-crystallin family)